MDYRLTLILINMASDERTPRAAIGYIDDLASGACADYIKRDRLNQLRRYVPDLVARFEEVDSEGRAEQRTTIIIKRHGEGFVCTTYGVGGGPQGARCGKTPEEAAMSASEFMIKYAQSNPKGGDLVAPDEVIARVPAHLRSIPERA